jgi:hypothetical protein
MWIEILKEALFKLLPFLRKMIYPLDKLKEDIQIGLRPTNPVSFEIYNIPKVVIYLEITNLSQYLPVTLDRLYIDVWLKSEHEDQPLIWKLHYLEKQEIKQKKKLDVYIPYELNFYHVKKLQKIRKETSPPKVTFHIDGYFNCEMGSVKKSVKIEHVNCVIEGQQND